MSDPEREGRDPPAQEGQLGSAGVPGARRAPWLRKLTPAPTHGPGAVEGITFRWDKGPCSKAGSSLDSHSCCSPVGNRVLHSFSTASPRPGKRRQETGCSVCPRPPPGSAWPPAASSLGNPALRVTASCVHLRPGRQSSKAGDPGRADAVPGVPLGSFYVAQLLSQT